MTQSSARAIFLAPTTSPALVPSLVDERLARQSSQSEATAMSEAHHTPAKVAMVTDKGRSVLAVPRVRAFIDSLVEGQRMKEAAASAGLRIRRAKALLDNAIVRREINRQLEVLRESNRARNILLRETLRDRGLEPDAPAALAKVALEAAKQLDGDDGNGSNTTVNVNNVIAGYVIDLRGEVEGPRVIGNRSADAAKSLINKSDVTDVEG